MIMRVIDGGCAAAGSFSRSFRLYVYIVVAGIWMDEKMSKDEGERDRQPPNKKRSKFAGVYTSRVFAQDESLVTISKASPFFSLRCGPFQVSIMTRQIYLGPPPH